MPLHNWTDCPGWEGVHHLWIADLLRWVKPRLPEGYRAYIGAAPRVAVGAPAEQPDVGVHKTHGQTPEKATNGPPRVNIAGAARMAPDQEIAVAVIDPESALFVESHQRLVAAVELISPRNKDRPIARATYLARYAGYLLEGVHLLLIDVHPRPAGFSFAEQIAAQLQFTQESLPAPFAVSYRVGEPAATGGRILGIWRRALQAAQRLPVLPLPLSVDAEVPVDLEATYVAAAADAYLE